MICITRGMRFEWDENKVAQFEAERGIRLSDAEEVFYDARAIDFYDEFYSISEDRYVIIGLSGKGLLTVVYTVREDEGEEVYRIITAWHSTDREEGLYEKRRAF